MLFDFKFSVKQRSIDGFVNIFKFYDVLPKQYAHITFMDWIRASGDEIVDCYCYEHDLEKWDVIKTDARGDIWVKEEIAREYIAWAEQMVRIQRQIDKEMEI